MKKNVFLIAVLFAACFSSTLSFAATSSDGDTKAKVVKYPTVGVDQSGLVVDSVKLADNQTVLSLSYTNSGNDSGEWFNINKDSYIVANGQKYSMLKADGIAIAPERSYFTYDNEKRNITLYFPAIPKSTPSIDFIESLAKGWKMYNIMLK